MDEINKLKDIKPPVEIFNIGSLVFTVLMILAIIAFLIFGYLLFKKLKKRKRRKKTKKEIALSTLKNIDFKDTKKAVYDFTENAFILVKGEKEKELEKFIKELEIYKYKKNIPPLSKEHIEKMRAFIKELEK